MVKMFICNIVRLAQCHRWALSQINEMFTTLFWKMFSQILRNIPLGQGRLCYWIIVNIYFYANLQTRLTNKKCCYNSFSWIRAAFASRSDRLYMFISSGLWITVQTSSPLTKVLSQKDGFGHDVAYCLNPVTTGLLIMCGQQRVITLYDKIYFSCEVSNKSSTLNDKICFWCVAAIDLPLCLFEPVMVHHTDNTRLAWMYHMAKIAWPARCWLQWRTALI